MLLIPSEAGELETYGAALSAARLEPVIPPSRRAAMTRLRYVDLVIVEIGRVDSESWEICRSIRSQYPRLPLVIVSQREGGDLVGRVLALGADDHLSLPLPPGELVARVRARIARHRTDRESLEAADKYRRLVMAAPVPLFILENGWFAAANQCLGDFVETSVEDLLNGRSICDLLVDEDRVPVTRALERWARSREEKLRMPVRVLRKGGEAREAELTLGRLGRGSAEVYAGTLLDISRQRKALRIRQQKEEYFRSLIEEGHDIIMVVQRNGTIRYASPSLQRVMGYEPERLEERKIFSLIHRDDAEPTRQLLERIHEAADATVTSRCRLRNADGEWRVIEFTARDLSENPSVGGVVINARDVTEQQTAENALRHSETRFRLMVEGSRDVFFYVRKAGGELIYVSPSVEAVLGHEAEELVGRSMEWLRTAAPPPDAEITPSGSSRLVLCNHRDGRTVTLELVESASPDLGHGAAIQGFARDVSERERMQEALRNAAFQDSLTGLPNRSLFTDRVRHAIARMKRHPDHAFALLFLDLDRFKVINDSLGHGVGDHLLVAVAERLKQHLRPEDTLARFGGDEFAVLLEDIATSADAPRVARRISEVLSTPFDLNGYEVYTSASIGIVLGSTLTDSPEALIQNADMAMYRAKSTGGSSFELYDQPMHAAAVRRLQMESQLRRAVERDELMLVYQPIVHLTDGSVAGVEALVRWKHPTHGVIAPADFIGLAEETGFISVIGDWVLRTACLEMAGWQTQLDRPDLFVSVNLSSRQLRDSTVLRQVQSALKASDLDPATLKLEITESTLVQSRDRAVRVLRDLMGRGVQIFLDDFGTGYASLSYLHTLPLNGLKIDRSFVSRMHNDERYAVLVESTMNIAKGLGLTVVAEGIEEAAQAQALVGLACDYAQGFYFSRPLPPARIPAVLSKVAPPLA